MGEKKKNLLKIFWHYERPKVSTEIFRKKSKCGDILLLDFKFGYKAIVSRTTLYEPKPYTYANGTE